MTTRDERLRQFSNEAAPPAGQPFELLCEDGSGTYLVPFPCHWKDGVWRGIESGAAVEAAVVGWRRADT